MNQIRGAADVLIQLPPGTPQLIIRFRSFDIHRWGFDPVDLQEAVGAAYEGSVVDQVYEGNRVFDVSVILDRSQRKSIEGVGKLPLRNQDGTYVQRNQLADMYQSGGAT